MPCLVHSADIMSLLTADTCTTHLCMHLVLLRSQSRTLDNGAQCHTALLQTNTDCNQRLTALIDTLLTQQVGLQSLLMGVNQQRHDIQWLWQKSPAFGSPQFEAFTAAVTPFCSPRFCSMCITCIFCTICFCLWSMRGTCVLLSCRGCSWA